jgi:galactokinase
MSARDDEGRRPELVAALQRHARAFREIFPDTRGLRLFFSPGRVNLMGAHLDYNGGPVMPTAIDRGTFFAVRRRADDRLRLASTLESGRLDVGIEDLPRRATGVWYDYPLGVVRRLVERAPLVRGIDLLVGGNLPIGAGLSSSASICVGTAFALDAAWGLHGSMRDCIDAALFAERRFVGVQCGIMDPYAVGLTRPGHLLWLDCRDGSVEHLPLDSTRVAIAVVDSGVRRSLAQGAFNQRVEECQRALEILRPARADGVVMRDVSMSEVIGSAEQLGPELTRRARHVASEVARAFEARSALGRGDLARFGALMNAAHASLRDDYEVSVPELDLLAETAQGIPGVLGARLTGAGFGGCIVVLLAPEACPGFGAKMQSVFASRFGRTPELWYFRGDSGPREVVIDAT